ncbi:MAG: TolC family protein, partial [Thiobacillus sp.]|nr:TolC family protein [Thiobacillus sp.]
MRRAARVALLAWALSGPAAADKLTLEVALAAAQAPHPDYRIAESELALAEADRAQTESRQDFALYLDGSLRTGLRPDGDWKPDNVGRIVARKPLFDFGRTRGALEAADREIAARQAALINTGNLRRLDIMARYFDVLIADMQYAADNEFMAVAYVAWDNARQRFDVGQIGRPELEKLEADYQDIRERRNASQQRMRAARQKLAHALGRPAALPAELDEPALKDNDRPVADYETLLPWVRAHNLRALALRAQIQAADARIAA